jgi:transposase InsO family protein
MKYRFIKSQRTQFKVATMCRVLEVSKSGYYDWLNRPESSRSKRHRYLITKIRQIHIDNRQIYGSPRIHGELVAQGEKVGKNTVAYLMHKHNIQSKVHKRFIATTDSRNTKKPAGNILNQQFRAQRPNQKWVSDVTFIPTKEGWLYLATIMDLYSRLIIGWSMGNKNNAELVENALKMASDLRGNAIKGVLLHSDQGVQYASTSYQNILRQLGVLCSMSRKGNCWDNAPMESFFHSLKTEWVAFEDYKSRSQARSSLFSYIELFYNRKRRHSSLGNKSPMAFESAMDVS